MGNRVFICYVREDEQFVRTLAGPLKSHGVPVWLDRWDIPAGANWQRSIDNAIQDCAQFLIILLPAAVESEEVQGELPTAARSRIPPRRGRAGPPPRQCRFSLRQVGGWGMGVGVRD